MLIENIDGPKTRCSKRLDISSLKMRLRNDEKGTRKNSKR